MSGTDVRKQQEAIAYEILSSYKLGEDVIVDYANVWQRSTSNCKDCWLLVMYYQGPSEDSDDCERVSFFVEFVQDTVTLADTYAYWWDDGGAVRVPWPASASPD